MVCLALVASVGSALTLGEALNATNGIWETGGDAPWVVDTNTLHNGLGSIRSGVVTNGQVSWVQLSFAGPANLYCAGHGDTDVAFSSDRCGPTSIPEGGLRIEGSYAFQPLQCYGASNVVRWTHYGSGAAWVDQIQIVPDTNVPFIVTRPADQYAYTGDTPLSFAEFTVVATGEEPLAYFWFKDWTLLSDDARISGSRTATLCLTNLVSSDEGTYSVLVSNRWGQALFGRATGGGAFQQCGNGAELHVWTVITVPYTPTITNLIATGTGQVQFQFAALPGKVVRVLASTNLSDWEVVSSVTNGLGLVNFSEPTVWPNRFYRLQVSD